MLIRFVCPACKKNYKANPEQSGKTIVCRKCKATIIIPTMTSIEMLSRVSASPNEPSEAAAFAEPGDDKSDHIASTTASQPKPVPLSLDDDSDDSLESRLNERRERRAKRQLLRRLVLCSILAIACIASVLVLINLQQGKLPPKQEVAQTDKIEGTKKANASLPIRRTPNSTPIPAPPADRPSIILPERPGSEKSPPLSPARPMPMPPPDTPKPPDAVRQPPVARPPEVDEAKRLQLAKLAEDLKSKDAKVRLRAAEDIGRMGKAAASLAKQICDAVLDMNEDVRIASLTSLEALRPDLYNPIAKLLLDMNTQVREKGALELAKLGEEAKPAAAILISVLRQSMNEQNLRVNLDKAVFLALKKSKPDDEVSIRWMKAFAKPTNESSWHRLYAMDFLAQWAAGDEDRQKELLPLIKAGLDTSPEVRIRYGHDQNALVIACINLAGKYGAMSKDLLPILKQFKLSSDTALRDAANKAVKLIEG